MLRPKRMSKVSVTGARSVVDDVIEAAYEQRVLHLSEYDGSWTGFEPGDSLPGADDTAQKLVTVRALEDILDVEPDDAGPRRVLEDEELETELEAVRERVNDLDEEREALRDRLRELREEIDRMEPFADLGIDLDLLSGYRSVDVLVGRGKPDAVAAAVADADGIDGFELFAGDGDVVAVVARPAADAGESPIADALVGVDFTALDVPDAEGSPEEYVRELEAEREQVAADLDDVEDRLAEVSEETAGFLLAAEERLTIESEKKEAPLAFATTENAFVAEGWIPTERYDAFEAALRDAVGDHAEIEELERASFTRHGAHTEPTEAATADADAAAAGAVAGPAGDGTAAAAGDADDGDGDADGRAAEEEEVPAPAPDGGEEDRATTDGGYPSIANDDPPVVQDNGGAAKPFEVLITAVNRPRYSEFDPTVLVFLTFPLMFGFMIGDLGYGILYMGIGAYLYGNFESDAITSMGGIALWAGGFTALFGVLYGEFFGLHQLGEIVWGGHPPMEKGLSPATIEWALTWLTVSVLFGVLHLDVGYALDFYENLQFHGPAEAVYESGSWLFMLNGLWIWVFSESAAGTVPDFIFTIFDGEPIPLGFAGFPELVGLAGAGLFVLGFVLLAVFVTAEVVEFLQVLVNALSYTRITAVLLAKAGMAFTVNLLAFGAYQHDGEFHFMIEHGPEWVIGEYGAGAIMFAGLFNAGGGGFLAGVLVLVVGHLLVLALGITSAGIQGVRLEYVEFFGKFYEGGGREYLPFGRERRYTADAEAAD